jgi:hypothetical protein
MSKDQLWIDKRLRQCMKGHPSVTNAATGQLKSLLEGKAHERLLTQGELLATAAQLMQDMVKPVASEPGGRDAN